MTYVDGYLIPLPKAHVEAYREIAREAGAFWMEQGALSYVECVADDVPFGETTSFPRALLLKDDEVVAFSWIVFPSRDARDEINRKVMANERMAEMMKTIPVDMSRMIWGGFRPIVEL